MGISILGMQVEKVGFYILNKMRQGVECSFMLQDNMFFMILPSNSS